MRRLAHAGTIAVALCLTVWTQAVQAVIVDPTTLPVKVGGEEVGTITMKISTLGLGGGLIGLQSLVGSFDVTKKKPGGTTMTLDELEAFLGQDHLNWFQIVTGDTHPPKKPDGTVVTPPYIDPPKGGYADLFADGVPWYWNETAPPAGETRPDAGQLSDRSTGSTLDYEDAPTTVDATNTPIAGAKVDFVTFLISDFGNKTYQVLNSGVSWTMTMETVPGKGVFPHITALTGGAGFTDQYAKLISDEFGYTVIPEPATMTLLGLGWLGATARRRTVRRRRGAPSHPVPKSSVDTPAVAHPRF